MASRVDNIASNLSLANFSKATELKQRIWFTVGALIVFRFLSFVPLPGVNPLILSDLYDQTRGGTADGLIISGNRIINRNRNGRLLRNETEVRPVIEGNDVKNEAQGRLAFY